jgi:tight adherence protein B
VTGAAVLSFVAGVCAVLGAWDGLAALDGRAPLRALERWLAPLRAGREPTPAERRRLALVGAGTLAASGWLLAGPVLAVVLGTLGPAAAKLATTTLERRRCAERAANAPGVARVLADAIAAGHSVRGAILAAAPADAELARAARALELGERTDEVLDDLRRRAQAPAWDTLTAAILLQADAGGDLAGLLRGLAARLEQQRRDAADARSATAQARFTAWLVAALPLGAAILAELASPGFLAGLASEPLTAALAGVSLALQLLAIATIRRIAGASGSGS